LPNPFRTQPRLAWSLLGAVAVMGCATTALAGNTARVRYERDINRIVFNQNWELLDDLRRRAGAVSDSLQAIRGSSPELPADAPYLVVSLTDRQLWYKQGDRTLFTARVAVGSGKTLVRRGSSEEWKFDTPRGRFVILRKEADPVWVPPDWHYEETARNRKLGVVTLNRGQTIALADGSSIEVAGSEVVRRYPDGTAAPYAQGEGREILADGKVVIPPFGTNQRKYPGVLGSHRLHLGDGYALHGTNKPQSIGQAVSHGCIRLRNEDVAHLFDIVPVGTQVFIY
jgi:hypothetical protein